MENLSTTNERKDYNCKYCNYTTSKKHNWERHIKTNKHKENKKSDKWICGCGKIYSHKSGLSRHKKTCTFQENKIIENEIIQEFRNEFEELKKQNKKLEEELKELRELIVKQKIRDNNQ